MLCKYLYLYSYLHRHKVGTFVATVIHLQWTNGLANDVNDNDTLIKFQWYSTFSSLEELIQQFNICKFINVAKQAAP